MFTIEFPYIRHSRLCLNFVVFVSLLRTLVFMLDMSVVCRQWIVVKNVHFMNHVGSF